MEFISKSLDNYLSFSKGPNRVGVSLHLKTETDQVFETLFSHYFEFRTMDKPSLFRLQLIRFGILNKENTFHSSIRTLQHMWDSDYVEGSWRDRSHVT
jgi:hypothetical protein